MLRILAIIPVFNKEQTVERCVQSVLDQVFNCDIVVVNDGSTDTSADIVAGLISDRTTLISQQNQGVSAARNLGLKYAQEHNYDHIFLLDADDYWLPNHVETHVSLSRDFPKATAFGTNYSMHKSGKTETTRFTGFQNQDDQVLNDFFNHNFLNCIFHSSSISFKTSILKETGYFNDKVSHAEDTDFFIRVGLHSKVAFSHKVTAMIDVSAENRSDVVDMEHRRYPDFNIYGKYIDKHKGLKKYLDLNRFAIALLYRINDEINKAKDYENPIDLNNLTFKQRQLLKLSGKQLNRLKKVQEFLFKNGISFKNG